MKKKKASSEELTRIDIIIPKIEHLLRLSWKCPYCGETSEHIYNTISSHLLASFPAICRNCWHEFKIMRF